MLVVRPRAARAWTVSETETACPATRMADAEARRIATVRRVTPDTSAQTGTAHASGLCRQIRGARLDGDDPSAQTCQRVRRPWAELRGDGDEIRQRGTRGFHASIAVGRPQVALPPGDAGEVPR